MQRHESLQPLSREHHQTLRLARLLQGGEADVDLREALASHRAALQVHFAEEETIGRQAIGQCPEDGILAEQVERMQREHRQIERLIAGVLDGEDGSTGYRRLGRRWSLTCVSRSVSCSTGCRVAVYPHRGVAAMSEWRKWPLLSIGFRPWFLLMLGFATLAMALWAGVWVFGGWEVAVNGHLDWRWHAHEMIFGVGVALVAGFLTTAAQNWTGRRAWHPTGLLAVLSVWIAARLGFLLVGASPLWPYLLSIAAELGILFVVARLIVLSRQRHNLLFVVALAGVVLADVVFSLQRHEAGLASIHGWVGLLPIVAMLLFMAQRVVPPFSANRLGVPPRRTGRYVAVTLGGGPMLMFVVLLAAPVLPDVLPLVAALIAVLVAVTAGYALARWWHWPVLTEPMLWLLFLGVFLVLVGLAWMAAVLAGLPVGGRDGPVHALGLGMLAVMAMGMMTRVSAGHTGRPVCLPQWLRPVLALLLAVVASRLLLPIWPGLEPVWLATTAGGLALVYLALLLVIGPWLVAERADARPADRS